MNHWTKLSIEFANQRNYLDELFSVYPTIPEGIRDINKNLWQRVEQSFLTRNNVELLNILGQYKHNIMSALVLREFLYSL